MSITIGRYTVEVCRHYLYVARDGDGCLFWNWTTREFYRG